MYMPAKLELYMSRSLCRSPIHIPWLSVFPPLLLSLSSSLKDFLLKALQTWEGLLRLQELSSLKQSGFWEHNGSMTAIHHCLLGDSR